MKIERMYLYISTTDVYKFKRLTFKNINQRHTHIVIKCIDDNSTNLIRANTSKISENIFFLFYSFQ